MYKSSIRWMLAGVMALAMTLSSAVFGQGVTTSGIAGFVVDKAGKPVVGAKVTALHAPTGTRASTLTRSGGQYAIDGLRPGGPYTVSVEGTDGTTAQTTGLYADVGSTLATNFTLSSDVVKLDAVTVGASRDTTFDASAMGTATNFSAKDIGSISSVRQDVQDLENMDPRVSLSQSSNGDSNYQLSVQGQNPRENLFLIDGVSATDNFGLNSNGYAGLRNPLPLSWIESAAFELNQYDVAYSGFVGAVLNATLKSGTNEFHGELYNMYTGTNFRGPDPVVGALGAHEQIQLHTTGATLGGPIIKDKLFFFVGYEAFRELAQPPAQQFLPTDNAADTAVVNQILAKALSLGDTQQGSFYTPLHTWQQNFVAKIDWNINDMHKFEFTFRHNDGRAPLTYNYTSSFETSLSGSWYDSHRVDQSYTAKINSDWSNFLPGLRTELESTYKRYNGTAVLEGTDWASVTIYGVNGTSLQGGSPPYELYLGPSPNYQANALFTQEVEEHAFAELPVGDHTFKLGLAFDRVQMYNIFIPNYLGTYSFSNVADFLNATPTGVTLEAPAPGFTLQQAIAHYAQLNVSPSIQDTWKPNDHFSVVAGIRLDDPIEPANPPTNPIYAAQTGTSNATTINGNYTISPRFGFNWEIPGAQKTQIRGGAGLFLGTPPFVWLENSFSAAGALTTYTINNSSVPIANGTYIFTGNPATQALPPANLSNPVPSIDILAPNFHNPANWKENLAIDRQLPFLNLVLTAEVDLSQVQKDIYYTNTNLKLATSGPAFMPDGAIRYAGNITPTNIGSANFVPGYTTANFYTNASSNGSAVLEANSNLAQIYELNNTDKGGSQEYTLSLGRKMKDGWAYSLGYTHTHATQVASLGGTTAGGGYGQNFLNPNDNVAYRSVWAAPDKVVANLSHQMNFFHKKDMMTTISAQFIGQTGQAFSYEFKGDADGSGSSNQQLFYVPTGPSDPKVTWLSATEESNFFNVYLPAHPDLAKYAGQVAPRNAFYFPWQKTLNLMFEQQVPVYKDVKLTLFADCFNFANLLSKKWGVVMNYGEYNDSGGRTTVAGTGYNPAGNNGQGQYIYVFNSGTQVVPTTYSDESRWMIQVGAKLSF